MLKRLGKDIAGHTCHFGLRNVAWVPSPKLTSGRQGSHHFGPDGYVYDPDGISGDKINYMLELRASNQDIVEPYSKSSG